jgi:ArsR family transcriptional regulator
MIRFDAADAFRALGHPLRLRIADMLATGDKCVCEIFQALGVSQPNVSQHLNVMRSGGVVGSERRGAHVYYRLVSPEITEVIRLCRVMAGEPLPSPYIRAEDPCGESTTTKEDIALGHD